MSLVKTYQWLPPGVLLCVFNEALSVPLSFEPLECVVSFHK